MHTSLMDPSIVIVVELVSMTTVHGNINNNEDSSSGWAIFYPFKLQELTDTSDTDSPLIQMFVCIIIIIIKFY